jgi:hypothetical protein
VVRAHCEEFRLKDHELCSFVFAGCVENVYSKAFDLGEVKRWLQVEWIGGSDSGVSPGIVWADMAETGLMDDGIERTQNDQCGGIIVVKH